VYGAILLGTLPSGNCLYFVLFTSLRSNELDGPRHPAAAAHVSASRLACAHGCIALDRSDSRVVRCAKKVALIFPLKSLSTGTAVTEAMKYVPGNDIHFGGRTEYSSLAKFYLGNKFYWATQGLCCPEALCSLILRRKQ
jgi:hypothetical protein